MSTKKKAKPAKNPAPKVGDVEIVGGIEMQVMSVRPTKGGQYQVEYSAEPLAKKRGYRKNEEALGFKIEHYPPPFVGRGTRRDSAKLRDADWNLRPLLDLPFEEKKLALWHELARESARLREAFRLLAEKRNLPINYWKRGLYLDNPDQVQQMLIHDVEQAEQFLHQLMRGLPRGFNFEDEWIPADIPWLEVDSKARKGYVKAAIKVGKDSSKRPSSLKLKDVPVLGPSGYFGEVPLQVAKEWKAADHHTGLGNRPVFLYNSGLPELPELTSKGNGKDADQILTECADICVCFNYRDEDIIEAFTQWLKSSRARMVEDLKPFRDSSKRPYTKMNNKDVDAAIKGLSALRLLAVMKPLEATNKFLSIYFPNQKHRAADIGNLQKAARIPVEWQEMFFPYCPLDSAPTPNPDKGQWDLDCPMCFRVLRKHEKEPNPISTHYFHEVRCPSCDHRIYEHGWDGEKWVPFVWPANDIDSEL